ncbi:class I SAM-dependent methyltransferase [Clostridium sp.]|jgi:ubiquinone/menaquinone biosynthesis C-methylase UbiE|uniref:class I SAM-dependent methyltransferase n=1 Tax=Clostridium sp. TaxID=1506 RepID=UPI00258290C1|nr:class I SAM-dependent methyltransferase [Clostridium sp.]MDF2505642.1 Methyltransferase type 11 [Clostridium sp.]
MNNNIEIVKSLYSDEHAIGDMRDYTKKKLKVWENEAISYFPVKSWVLDIGCGMGREAFCLYDKGFKITAIDISEKVIEPAKQFALESKRDIEFLLTNGLDLPFESNTFDVVIIWAQTLGLFYGEENKIHILKECNRVLKSNGILSFSGHDKEFLESKYPQYLDDKKFFAYANTNCYWEIFTDNKMIDLAQKTGFTVMECKRGMVYKEEDGPILYCVCRK